MPFTLSQLKSQDLRDIDHFYVQNNVGKVNNANAQVFEERNTFLLENEDHPAHYEHRKKNKSHDAHLYTNIEGTGMEEENDIFKTSTQVSAYRAFSSGVEEDNGILKTSTQVSASVEAPNIENYLNELKKKHKKSLHKDNLYENLCENFQTKKEKNKAKLKSVMDVRLQDSNEDVFQDTESSCATEGSSKPKKKKKKQKLLENGYALNNSFLRNDGVSVSNIDSNSASGKTKRKQKGNMNYDHDTITESLDYLNTADINKRKKRKLQSTCENNSEKNNLHFTSGALTENTDKLNDFVMPKNLKQEEDNTFSTDSDLLDSYLYFSYKNKQLKKKIKSLPMPIVIKTENDLDEEEQCLKNAMQNTPIHSDQSLGHISKRHKKKRKNCSVENDKNDSHDEPTNLNKKHKDHLVEQDKNDSHDEAKSINKKHKKKHKQALEDEVKSKDADSEQITSSNHEVHENAKCMPTDEEEQFFKNDMMNSSVHSDQSISSRSKKREKKHKDYLVEQDKNDSHDEAKSINKKHKKKHKQALEDELKSKDADSEQITSSNHEVHENAKCMPTDEEEQFFKNDMMNSSVHSDQSISSRSKKREKKHKDYLVEQDKNDSYGEAENINKKHKKKHKDYLVEEDKSNSHEEAQNINKEHKKKHKNCLGEEDKNDFHEKTQNINKKHKDYLVEDDKNDSREAQNLNKRKKKCKDYLVENKIDSHDEATNLNKRHKKKHKDYLVEEDKNDPYEEAQNINKKHKKKHRQQAFEDELRSNENEESYLSLKNVLLDTELPLQTSDVNDEEINLDSDRKSKKHKKKSKDRNNFVEITSVDKEKSIAEEEQENIKENFGDEAEKLIGKTESVSDECSEQKLKRKNKKCKLKVETRERKNDIISKPEVDESSSPDGPDDKHYLKKRNGGMEICNFKVGRQMQTGLLNTEDITDTDTDRFEMIAIIKRGSDLFQLQENNDVGNDTLNRKVNADVVNAFKEKLTTVLNQCSKQICSESIKALEIDTHGKNKTAENNTLFSLRVNLTFTRTRNNIQEKVDCHKDEKLPKCEELKDISFNDNIIHDNEFQDHIKIKSDKNEKLFERKESKNVSLSTIITQDDLVQECTTVNCYKSKELPEYEESKVTATQLDDCIKKSGEIKMSTLAIDCKDNPEMAPEFCTSNEIITQDDLVQECTTVNCYKNKELPEYEESKVTATQLDDCIKKSGEIKMSTLAIDCKDNPEMAPEFCTSSEISQKINEDITVCEDINFNSSSTSPNKNVIIIQNVTLTESEEVINLPANNNMEIIDLKETKLPEISEIESQLESITEEDIMLIAEEFNYINANNYIQADKNSNDEMDGTLKNSEIHATNSERYNVSNVTHNSCMKKVTIFDEETVILSPNKIKALASRSNKETSKENDNQTLESTSTITKEVEECSSLSFKSPFNNAKTNTQRERTKEAECQKQLIFNKEPEDLNTDNITENSSAVNNKSKASNKSNQNEIKESQGHLSFMNDLKINFEDLDSSFFLSDSDSDTQKEQIGKSSSQSKDISPDITDLYNRLTCDTSIDGDDTTTAGDIINEALDSAIESSIQLVEEYQFLKDLVIFISWEIPIAHTIETRMSSHPSPAQKQKFKELNIQLKQGPYTKEEDNKILSNFEEFCKVHDIPNDTKPFLNFKHGRQTLLNIKQRINFVQYLGKGLECRMLHSIYRRFVCLSTEKKKGRFTAEEDAIIEKYISNKRNEHDNNKFSTLAKILNRHRLAVEKRHKYLLSKQKHRKDNYKIKEHIPEYLKHLMEILEVNEVSQLKDMKITRNVWLKLADKIGQSEIKMKRLWETTIYPRLFAKNPIDRDGLMKQLILKLIKLKKTDFRDVNWCEMASEFENITPAYLYQMFKYLTVNFVPERKRHDLSSTLKHLARAYKEHDCIMKMQSKMEFKNGQVSFVTGS